MANVKIKPIGDRVLVEHIEEKEQVRGGIIIPDSAKEKPAEGEVVAVGAGKANDKGVIRPLDVKKSNHILFGKYSGNEVKIDGIEHLLLREDEVLGVLEK